MEVSGGQYSNGGAQSSSSGGQTIGIVGGGYSNGGQQSGSESEGGYNSGSYFGSESSRDKALNTHGFSGSSGSFSSNSNHAETTSLGGGQGSSNLNVLIGSALGPGDYHGTISKAELEREAGGAIFSAGSGSETDRPRQHNTRDQGMKMNKVKTQSQEGTEEANTMEEEVIVLGEAALEARQEASVEIPEATI